MNVLSFVKILLHSDLGSTLNNLAILIFRILLSIELLRVHGLKKLNKQNGVKEQVPNPLHLPEKLNALVATFSDTVVPIFVILGLAARAVVLPTIGVTAIGYFVVHRSDTAEVRDIPFMYTLSFLLILMVGAGSYSLDNYILKHVLY